VLLAAIQQVQIVPLIRAAEAFEAAHDAAPPSLAATLVADIVLATAFALLLAAAMSLRPPADWRAGILWGLAGYAAFFAAPAIGLPPELPGTETAALHERQLWWALAAADTAAGLAMLAFCRPAWLRAAGIAVLLLPHVVGAPHPAAQASSVPPELAGDFVRATWLANAAFWLCLGALVGWLSRGDRRARSNRSAALRP
jgi:cobalt transporter subunit CbtA